MGQRMAIAAGAAAIALAGCGGSSGSGVAAPPITDSGATVVAPASNPARAELLEIRGNTTNRTVIYVEEGALRLLLRQTPADLGQFIREFASSDGTVVAQLTTPPGMNDLALLRLVYNRGGEIFESDSVLGRATSLTTMPTTGNATFFGGKPLAAQLTLIDDTNNNDGFVGNAIVTADFDAGTVRALLDFTGEASTFGEPIDVVEISGMTIAGNRFSGGTLTSRLGADPVPAFSDPDSLASSGLFGGPDAAEVGGVFLARFPGDRLMSGRYLARQ